MKVVRFLATAVGFVVGASMVFLGVILTAYYVTKSLTR